MTAVMDLKADGTTLLTLANLCPFEEARDTVVNYGAAAGARMAWDRLPKPSARA
jgi:hypothetical protein